MALSHRKEIGSRPHDGEHGSPGDVPETSRQGFAQLPPTNVKEAVLHAGSVAECGEVQREGCSGAGHSQSLQGLWCVMLSCTSHRMAGCSWRRLSCARCGAGPFHGDCLGWSSGICKIHALVSWF